MLFNNNEFGEIRGLLITLTNAEHLNKNLQGILGILENRERSCDKYFYNFM